MHDFKTRSGDEMQLTPTQKSALEYLRENIIKHDGSPIRPEMYEYKQGPARAPHSRGERR